MTQPDDPDLARQVKMFKNRLKKRWRHLRKWAKREGVDAFRVYHKDIPELPFVVDWYDGRLHVAEFARRNDDRSDEQHEAWVEAMLEVAGEVMGVDSEDTFFKTRRRQKGSSQYQKMDAVRARFVVQEGGHRFRVNLSDYLDTGLFLDHRPTRAEVGEAANGKRFLNLFAYTGTFTVYAIAGGAVESLTLDLSNTYLAWAVDNLELNHMRQTRFHQIERADCCQWLNGDDYKEHFDLVVVDPPSFSNSKSMQGTFDVQRDHAWLLRATLKKTAPGGVVYFSTNRRGFKMQLEPGDLGCDVDIEEITHRSLDEDFKSTSIHRCFRMVKAS